MRRAVVIYLENKRHLMIQFGCLYTSLRYIQCEDTDLVVFGTKEALRRVPDDCVKIHCPPLSDPREFLNYRYMNSIACLTSPASGLLDNYDLILRTDVDTFLTPSWNDYYPTVYTVGLGAYAFEDEVKKNIIRVANMLGLKHQGIFNVGSTHYGETGSVRQVCELALFVAKHLLTVEFKNQEGKWPGWYRGVTSMYSSEIAVNHLVSSLCMDIGKLDFISTSQDHLAKHPHIHCWHTDQLFSKFQFAEGKYDNLHGDWPDLNKVREYCLYIALKSQREMPWLYLQEGRSGSC